MLRGVLVERLTQAPQGFLDPRRGGASARPAPAAGLLRRLQRTLPAEVFRWTGHFPEHTRALLRQMAVRAEELAQVYPAAREEQVERALAVMVTALAMEPRAERLLPAVGGLDPEA